MDTFVRDSSQFRKARTVYAHDGAAWRNCQKVWVHDGVNWRQVFQQFVPGFTASVNLPYSFESSYSEENVIAMVTVKTDGAIRTDVYLVSYAVYGDWAWHSMGDNTEALRWGTPRVAGIGSAYWAKLVITSAYAGAGGWPLFGSPQNVWHQLSSERYWFAQTRLPYEPNPWFSGTLYLNTSPSDVGALSTPFYLSAEVW